MVHRNLRIVFMGTPQFAVPSLQALHDAGYVIAGVITAPDKVGGRGKSELIVSPVKTYAVENEIPVFQPTNLKSPRFIKQLRSLNADLQVVVAFRMLPEIVWNMPRLGTMNLHASLLPAYRGAAPIQWAIINGETITGLTTFLLQQEIDTGKIIHQVAIPILPDDNAGSLHDRMMQKGAGLVVGSVDLLALGKINPKPQDESKTSHAPKINHETGRINWNQPAENIHNLVRAMAPYPGAWTLLDGKELKVFKTSLSADTPDGSPGIILVTNKRIVVKAQGGALNLHEIQLQGKKRMTAGEFLNGYKIRDLQLT